MDLNEIVDIANNKNYDSNKVKSRRVSPDVLSEFKDPSMVDRIDEMIYGGSDGQSFGIYNAKDDYEKLKTGINAKNAQKSKMPSAIKESILSNPLIMEPTDTAMDNLTERLEKAMPGIQRSMGILNKLEKKDTEDREKRLFESKNEQSNANGQIDYSLIKMIVEQAVEKKFNELSGTLNESVNHNSSPSLNVMKLGENFLFLDDQGNVYECRMHYKGKNRKKKS